METISVNCAAASQDGNGNWTATIPPIGLGGGLVTVMAVTNTDNDSVAATGQASGFHPLLNDDLSPPATYTQATVQPPQGVFVSQYHLNNQTTWCFADYPQPENFYTMMDWREFKSMAIDPGDTAFRAVSCQYNSTSSMDNKLA